MINQKALDAAKHAMVCDKILGGITIEAWLTRGLQAYLDALPMTAGMRELIQGLDAAISKAESDRALDMYMIDAVWRARNILAGVVPLPAELLPEVILGEVVELHGWESIETAPKDGRKIIAYGTSKDPGFGDDIRAGTCYWHDGRWLGGPFNSHCEPEWWQPFPEIPHTGQKHRYSEEER